MVLKLVNAVEEENKEQFREYPDESEDWLPEALEHMYSGQVPGEIYDKILGTDAVRGNTVRDRYAIPLRTARSYVEERSVTAGKNNKRKSRNVYKTGTI